MGSGWKDAHAVILIPICFDECVSALILVEMALDVPLYFGAIDERP
jgi:hypothetical protein